ncbi:MAG: hypothetical protein U1F53_01495 [Burkholderiaceae bacterium]
MNVRTHPLRALAALALGTACAVASAVPLSRPVYDLAKDQLKVHYKAERDACDAMAGNTKDVCVERAKGREKVAMAHLQYQLTNSDKDRRDYLEARYEARYEVAKESCDSQAGNPRDVCQAQAKAARDKAKADLKANVAIREAQDDALEARWKADYKVAREQCDTLDGAAKESCVASAKARYYQ